MPRSQRQSAQRVAEERRDAVARASARWVDLQLDFVDERDGELLGRFGGQWDRARREFSGADAPRSRVIKLHPGQIEPARWFDWWLGHHLGAADVEIEPGASKVFDVLCAGGRRGGKSAFSFSCAVAYALSVPGATVWCVCPSDAFFEEPIAYLESIMPREWYESLGWPHWTYFLANGSRIRLRSGHTPGQMKKGKADFIVINEGQSVPQGSYDHLSASIVDSGGLVMTAANPPDAGDKGMWVADLAAGAERGDRKHARYFFFDPLDNPHIDQAALAALAEKYDEHTFDVQVRGLFLLPPDTVLHSWDRKGNEQPMPAMGDVTRAFTKHFEGREYDDIVGVDVQNYPWIAGVRMRAYRNPEAPGDITQSLLWCVGEVFLEAGDEVDFCEGLRSIGCHPDRTLVIADATCDYQQQQRDKNKQRPKYSGKGSMDMFRGEGFVHVVPPDDQMDRNPLIEERCRAANARIKTKGGKRFVFADPKRCEKTVTSIRQWRRGPNGGPSRKSKGAHAGDALSYVLWRFFPRRRQNDKVEIKTFKRFQGTTRTRGF